MNQKQITAIRLPSRVLVNICIEREVIMKASKIFLFIDSYTNVNSLS